MIKNIRFKSLTMRIWFTFTAIILIIILSISLLYLVILRKVNENNKIQDLKVVHDIILKSNNYDQTNRFNEMKNLMGSGHFIVIKSGSKTELIKDIDNGKNVPPPPGPDIPGQPEINDNSLKEMMAGFIKSNTLYEKQFSCSYRNMKYLFIISAVNIDLTDKNDKSFLISYIPDMQDNSIFYTILIIGVIFIGIGFITAKVVAGYISKPLKKLQDYTLKIANKDWEDPISIKSDDEIGKLADSMNQMRTELKRADEEEKTFLQSISHDLKTPVMVIMSHAEAIIDGVYIDSVEKTAEIIRDEAINLDKKIKNLLYFNTLDYLLENNNAKENINFKQLIENIIDRFQAVNGNIEWESDLCETFVYGNIDKVKVSIENIFDNALRYADKKIGISLKKQGTFAVIEIYDDGPNIDRDHIERIFDNFYKDKKGNFGLGLAISRKIINFYKGDIKAVNRNKGVSFIIKYPAADKDKL